MVLLKDKSYKIGNIDATVLESPKLNPHILEMKGVLAEILDIGIDDISIKATTHESVDSFGHQEAIKSYCVCLISRSA